ncbi:hypothetical protein [Pseudoteredinibacter isoporae]|uniref:DUF4345 domain-containing protein n=1 Tax=Pseudoteredinibacter isoporae TaxID=570281 RepID=A0A7X0MW52_9GAMM|nr:hypothetical protein [Pseudoteredinibacter isoporae]MBB6520534.1 hypothetical protein [Pseudoteredinibacter isoporae]NHO86101.1 hypothetical protein [Pseudoteredinibacter isoporae]NIB25448.1 hypothetical protein [Pseudoteredinibacter isoporae]
MKVLVRTLSVLIVLSCAFIWVKTLISPVEMAQQLGLQGVGNLGLASIRGDMGGIFFITMVLTSLGLINKGNHWFAAAATVMLGVAIGRITGLIVDGYTEAAIIPLAAEFVLIAILFAAYKKA